MKKFWNTNRKNIVTFVICGALFVGVLSIIALICGAVMRLCSPFQRLLFQSLLSLFY